MLFSSALVKLIANPPPQNDAPDSEGHSESGGLQIYHQSGAPYGWVRHAGANCWLAWLLLSSCVGIDSDTVFRLLGSMVASHVWGLCGGRLGFFMASAARYALI